jgi:hypothetical protein
MSYLGKTPVDVVDALNVQSLTVDNNLTVNGNITGVSATLTDTVTYSNTNGTLYIRNGNTAGGSKITSKTAAGNANGYLAFEGHDKEYARFDSDGNVQHLSKPAYFARAWVNFKGTGTVSIRESGNVSSVTDLGTGDYRVNFSTAMTDANYSMHFGGSPTNGRFLVNWAGVINNGSNAVVNSTSNCRIAMIDGGSGSRLDSTNNYVSIFR